MHRFLCLLHYDAGDNVQVVGGHGYIREHPVELNFRKGRCFDTMEGLAIGWSDPIYTSTHEAETASINQMEDNDNDRFFNSTENVEGYKTSS
ncbi:MAG: hypothetical protein JXA41_08220 [Deltaproteobacteria bacterium]|nr:hypothetical protein [Deltaproteobacteria bacterium]